MLLIHNMILYRIGSYQLLWLSGRVLVANVKGSRYDSWVFHTFLLFTKACYEVLNC